MGRMHLKQVQTRFQDAEVFEPRKSTLKVGDTNNRTFRSDPFHCFFADGGVT